MPSALSTGPTPTRLALLQQIQHLGLDHQPPVLSFLDLHKLEGLWNTLTVTEASRIRMSSLHLTLLCSIQQM